MNAIMNSDQPHLRTQIPVLHQLHSRCRQFRQGFLQLRQQLQHLAEAMQTVREQLNRDHAAAVRTVEERVATEFQSRTEQISRFCDDAENSIQSELTRRISDREAAFQEAQEARRKWLENELWVLASVCDENSEHSPVSAYERALAVYETQRSVVDESINQVLLRTDEASDWLSRCHAGVDALLPMSTLEPGTAEQNREHVATECGEALRVSDEMFRLIAPQWVHGWRIIGISLVFLLVLIVPVTMFKADVRAFLNPEISSPDWHWLGVSSLISAGVVILGMTALLLIVQQRLRSRFAEILQRSANAQSAASEFRIQTVRELRAMKVAAESWQRRVVRVRDEQTAALQVDTESQLQALQQQHLAELESLRVCGQQELASIRQQRERDLAAMRAWRESESQRLHELMQLELKTTLDQVRQDIQRQTTMLTDHRTQLVQQWRLEIAQLFSNRTASLNLVQGMQDWPVKSGTQWTAPETLPQALPAGQFRLSVPEPPEDMAGDPEPESDLLVPAVLRFPVDMSLAIEHDAAGRDAALDFLRAILLKLLTSIPAGRFQLTLIDPVGLGQSFSAMMHLADFDEQLISHRIWTESIQIRDRLQKVTEHMENVFQTYLRSEFETIEEYNAAAGEVAEPYHFVVVAGFPTAFSEEAARHLASILTSGPRCGVHALLAWNPRQPLPRSFDSSVIRNACLRFQVCDGRVEPAAEEQHPLEFTAITPPLSADYVSLVRAVGENSKDSRRVEVSFSRIAPRSEDLWTRSTAESIELPIGRAGAARLQYLRLGRGTSQHVLIAGKTGSGKSTLLHILITNLALHYSPAEIQFFLIDFKKGVEFRTYAAHQLPHARVVAIESDREFGLSVLERLDEILQERGDTFRSQGVQDLPAFRRQFPQQTMPRILLLIDEFQEFFVAEDRVSSRAALLLDRLVRQGRAFGIHVILGSQTLGGAYSLARSTLGQIAVRVALQCSESDAHLILSEENSAARLLTRPGEAIYNDANGLTEGNHPFQIAWLNDARREQAIQQMLNHQHRGGTRHQNAAEHRMIVFEGTVPPSADVCGPLKAWLRSEPDATRRVSEYLPVWVGEPVAIAPPTCIELRRASGQNLLIIGQETDMADSVLLMAAISCFHTAARPSTASASEPARPVTTAEAERTAVPQFHLLHDGRERETAARFGAAFSTALPGRFHCHAISETESVIQSLHRQLVSREASAADGEQPELLLAIRNLGQFRALRRDEDEFGLGGFGEAKPVTVANQLTDLIRRGPLAGIHVMIWSDTFSNAMRWLSNSLLREFDNRIAFRMNQTDSASFVDTPVAATLTPGRAVLYRDQTGNAEKFRPFAWPSPEWFAATLPQPVVEAPEYEEFDIDSIIIE